MKLLKLSLICLFLNSYTAVAGGLLHYSQAIEDLLSSEKVASLHPRAETVAVKMLSGLNSLSIREYLIVNIFDTINHNNIEDMEANGPLGCAIVTMEPDFDRDLRLDEGFRGGHYKVLKVTEITTEDPRCRR